MDAMTQFNAPTYDVERPTGQCTFTGRTLEPGEPYVAALVELDAETAEQLSKAGQRGAAVLGLKRLDVSIQAWEQGQRPDKIFSHWKSTVPLPNQKKKIFVDDEVLMAMLRRLAETADPQRQAFRFVLCLILMRKKLLRYDGTIKRPVNDAQGSTAEHEWWKVTPKLDLSKGPLGKWNEGEMLEVFNPHLQDSQVAQVCEQLGEILEAEL